MVIVYSHTNISHSQYQTVPPAARTHFVSDKDELILEDETQRVTLSGELDVHSVVTGCVVAVYGRLQGSGVFVVEDFCWPEAECIKKPLPEVMEDKYVCVILTLFYFFTVPYVKDELMV